MGAVARSDTDIALMPGGSRATLANEVTTTRTATGAPVFNVGCFIPHLHNLRARSRQTGQTARPRIRPDSPSSFGYWLSLLETETLTQTERSESWYALPNRGNMNREESSLLLRRAQEGSGEALNALFEGCGEPLLAYVRLRLGARLRARLESRDILQATLLQAFEHLDQFEGSSAKSLLGWLVAIARNQIRDEADYHQAQRRDAARTVPLSGEVQRVAAEIRSEVSRIHANQEMLRLEQAIESLKPEHREVVLMRRYEELTFPEIGERLDRSPDACRMLYARAMTALTREVQASS